MTKPIAARRFVRASVAALAVLLSAGAGAQVVPTQDGRALDANPGVGSNAYNSIRQANPAFDSNLFITGQAGGGFYSFQGPVPYTAANQLALNVPSADLDTFIRQSVGVQYATNPFYGPRAYLAPPQTVLETSAIVRGQNLPGSSVPRTAYVPPAPDQAKALYQNVMEAYKPLMQNMAAQPLYQQIETAPLGALSTAAGMSPEMLTRPAVSPLFGVLGRQDQQRLLQELAQRQPALAQAQAQEAVAGQVKPLYEAIQPGPLQPEQARLSEAQQAALAAGKVTPPAPENATNLMTPTGQDVFMDMLIRQNEVRRQLTGESPTSRPGVESPAVERRDNELVVHHLAGVSADQLNQRMRVAEKLLSQGRYYEAAGEYRAAIALNRTNPLPWVGAGIALFGADDMLSAAAGVYEGLRRFPPAMETRFDIEGLLGQPMAQKRIGQLEERVERAGNQADPSLVFLAAFVRQCTGRNDLAVAHARKLLAYDSQDPLYQAYAHYLLADHSPAPATAPAER